MQNIRLLNARQRALIRTRCIGLFCRLEFLCAARIAAEVKRIGIERLKQLYAGHPALTTAQERELKAQNGWAWKEPERPVFDDDYEEAEGSEGAGAGAGAGAGTGTGTDADADADAGGLDTGADASAGGASAAASGAASGTV